MPVSSVVSYFVSTSNHNNRRCLCSRPSVVSYFVSTSNHNWGNRCASHETLFLILFLHQTTTKLYAKGRSSQLFLILFLHQTTTNPLYDYHNDSCFLFCFYIKPQLDIGFDTVVSVVSYFVSTSNHNITCVVTIRRIVVSYFVSTSNHNGAVHHHCLWELFLILFLHQTTTAQRPILL